MQTENFTPQIAFFFFLLPPSLQNCNSVFKGGMVSSPACGFKELEEKGSKWSAGAQSLGFAGGSTEQTELALHQ